MKERHCQVLVGFVIVLLMGLQPMQGQVVLLGDNAPRPNMNDGDFSQVWAYWRAHKQSPCWTTKVLEGKGTMGLSHGSLYSMCDVGMAESVVLRTNPEYQIPEAADILNWSFGADLEYISKGTISLSLIFGGHECLLAEKVKLKGSDKIIEHFKGTYTVTKEDASSGFPKVRATFYSERDIKVSLHYVNISVAVPEKSGPILQAEVISEGIQLVWADDKTKTDSQFFVYRLQDARKGYSKIGEASRNRFVDKKFINGIDYTYVVTRMDEIESVGSNKVQLSKQDGDAPEPPTELKAEVDEAEVRISWNKSLDDDVQAYSVYRGDGNGNKLSEIGHNVRKTSFMDFTPTKEVGNTYVVYAQDYSGNKSQASEPITARVNAVLGASFCDLIRPMPIHRRLSSEVWGADAVLPRDSDNGVEHPDWSYWGGRPVKDKDGLYHMCVTRWPANATKGHWEWPHSTVAHVVADEPTGPYRVKDEMAYDFHNGLGHNPDILLLNDGTYLLYALIDWEATLFTSKTMNGPWKRLGTMTVDWKFSGENEKLAYRYYRNLSGVQLDDGHFLFVTKGGEMMISKDENPLGPYKVVTETVRYNEIIPKKYRNSNYEDPVLWKDEVQYHMIINAFWDYRAIYLRSPDGINWKFNPGTAYTPNSTSYEDGTQTHWYKLERPHVLTDEYGRATHLSLAVIDVPKADDLARDRHSSKNIIMPLTVHKRLTLLNKKPVNQSTETISLLIYSEAGFDAQTDIDLTSLRFGASEEVNFGRGGIVTDSRQHKDGLLLVFDGKGHGITDKNFVGKLIGKAKNGELIVGFSKLAAD